MKYLIFDAGPIISLTMNGMLELIEKLKENFEGKFILTPQVKREVIDRPLKIKKYKLEALQVQGLIDKGILTMATEIVSPNTLEKKTKKVLKEINTVLRATHTKEKIKIIHEGEASCIAFSHLCKCENLIVIDERTTRMLTEAPEQLEQLMEKKLRMPLDANLKPVEYLAGEKYIRSSELAYIAYQKGLLPIKKNKEALDALLYGLKFKGTAIASSEIEEMKKLAR
jgi:predicted nucleic acid-binding protein